MSAAEDTPATSPPTKLVSHLLRNEPDLRDIVQEFVDTLPQRLEELKRAFAEQDWNMLAMLAHRLKGAGGSYGYPEISQLCAAMERSFRQQQAGDFDACVAHLLELTERAKAALADTQ